MAGLFLPGCPICLAEACPNRHIIRWGDRTLVCYECPACGSLLAWLGDDLWLDSDRWAYQRVGKKDKAYLLKLPFSSHRLLALLRHARREAGQPDLDESAWYYAGHIDPLEIDAGLRDSWK